MKLKNFAAPLLFLAATAPCCFAQRVITDFEAALLAQRHQEVAALKARISGLASEISSLNDKLAEQEREVSRLNASNSQLAQDAGMSKDIISALQSKLARSQLEGSQLRQTLGERQELLAASEQRLARLQQDLNLAAQRDKQLEDLKVSNSALANEVESARRRMTALETELASARALAQRRQADESAATPVQPVRPAWAERLEVSPAPTQRPAAASPSKYQPIYPELNGVAMIGGDQFVINETEFGLVLGQRRGPRFLFATARLKRLDDGSFEGTLEAAINADRNWPTRTAPIVVRRSGRNALEISCPLVGKNPVQATILRD